MCFTHQRVSHPRGLYWLLLVIINLLANPALATDLPSRSKPLFSKLKLHRIIIKTIDNQKITGILYAVTDSSLIVCDRDHQAMTMLTQGRVPALKTIAAEQILKVRINPIGNLVAGTLGGGLVGFFALWRWEADHVNQSNPLKGEALMLNASLGGLCALVGFVGSLTSIRRFHIDKSQEQFLAQKFLLEKYTARQLMPNSLAVFP